MYSLRNNSDQFEISGCCLLVSWAALVVNESTPVQPPKRRNYGGAQMQVRLRDEVFLRLQSITAEKANECNCDCEQRACETLWCGAQSPQLPKVVQSWKRPKVLMLSNGVDLMSQVQIDYLTALKDSAFLTPWHCIWVCACLWLWVNISIVGSSGLCFFQIKGGNFAIKGVRNRGKLWRWETRHSLHFVQKGQRLTAELCGISPCR